MNFVGIGSILFKHVILLVRRIENQSINHFKMPRWTSIVVNIVCYTINITNTTSNRKRELVFPILQLVLREGPLPALNSVYKITEGWTAKSVSAWMHHITLAWKLGRELWNKLALLAKMKDLFPDWIAGSEPIQHFVS